MDTTIVQVFSNLPPLLQAVILLLLALSGLINHLLLAWTATPAPNTPWGRAYRALEVFGGLYGKAKEVGVPVPPQPTVAELLKEIEALKAQVSLPPFIPPAG